MGGQITMEFQRRYPRRMRALVLSNTSAPEETEDGKASRNQLTDHLLAEGMDGYTNEVIDKMLAAYNVTDLPEVAGNVLGMMRSTNPHGAAAALRGRAERPDYRPTLVGVDAPVLIVVGADDVYTPLSAAQEIYRHVPHAQLTVIDKAGHLRSADPPGDLPVTGGAPEDDAARAGGPSLPGRQMRPGSDVCQPLLRPC